MKSIVGISTAVLLSSLSAQEIDYVAKGKEIFYLWGCAECHVNAKDDNSIKTGPSLYNLFQLMPRDHAVVDANGKTINVKADEAYFIQSLRQPASHMAIMESAPTKGTPYPPIMPQFAANLLDDSDVKMVWHYLHSLADEGKAGPAKVLGLAPKKAVVANPIDDLDEVVVSKRARVFRAPVLQASGRAIHVGMPNGFNYSFDPRFLSMRGVWSGGFLNLKKERVGRSTPGSDRGLGSEQILDSSPLLVPLMADGRPLDLEFKEPDVADDAAVEKHLWKGGDFLKELASWDTEFKGYELDASDVPVFSFRIGKNHFRQKITFTDTGEVVIDLTATLAEPQVFQLRADSLTGLKVDGGTLDKQRWSLPAGAEKTYRLSANLGKSVIGRQAVTREESFAPQDLAVTQGKADLPPGYRVENWKAPLDTYGRPQLFEPTAIAIAKDGTIVVGTRTAGIYRLKNKKWELFAESTYECLGLIIEDDHGDVIVIAQKPELTRISDLNKDGRADRFQVVCDDFGFHGNYHEYTHGPVRDAEGNYYFTLNLCHSENVKASYKAGGNFMGSMGGFRGWACRVTPEGVFEPYASGVRSPAGLGTDPEGRIVYIDNQGEYFGSSKISYLKKGEFYGHPSGLVSLPGMKPGSQEILFENWKDKRVLGALWFPHSKYANSPGNPAWDLSGGKFGPYGKQMFVGDQTLSTLVRVQMEKVGEADQGAMMMFGRGFASGVMRPAFLPDGSLLLGQTGRGWRAKGGQQDALQQVIWDGKTVPADILSLQTVADGFQMTFSQPLGADVTPAQLLEKIKIDSWTYTDAVTYGSRENEKAQNAIQSATIAADRKSVHLHIADFATPEKVINRLLHLKLESADSLFKEAPAFPVIEVYQTIRAIPKK
jgi:hypothetical protein